MNSKTPRNEISEPVSVLGDLMSCMQRAERQQGCKVTQLDQTIDRMARMLQVHVACEEAQWPTIKEWLQNRWMKWDDHHKDNILWGAGIMHMTAKVQTRARVGKVAFTTAARVDERMRLQGRTAEE